MNAVISRPTLPQGMNKTETRWYFRLLERQNKGELQRIEFEPCSWRLGHNCFYHPDFMAIDSEDRIIFYEVKGFMRDDALVKLKTFARQYPFLIYLVTQRSKKAPFVITEIKP